MTRHWLYWPCALASLLALSGCAGSGLSTPALGGGDAALARNDPTARAFAVGTTSARAVKCGFYFDAAKLKESFLAAEKTTGATPENVVQIEKTYDVSFRTLTRVVADEPDYCTPVKVKYIKENLDRHLAGDFTPGPPPPKEQAEEGLFNGFGSGGGGTPPSAHPGIDSNGSY